MSFIQAQHYLTTRGWREVSPRVYTNRDGGLTMRIVPLAPFLFRLSLGV